MKLVYNCIRHCTNYVCSYSKHNSIVYAVVSTHKMMPIYPGPGNISKPDIRMQIKKLSYFEFDLTWLFFKKLWRISTICKIQNNHVVVGLRQVNNHVVITSNDFGAIYKLCKLRTRQSRHN